MFKKLQLTIFEINSINFSPIQTKKFDLSERIRHAVGSSTYKTLRTTCKNLLSSAYNTKSMTPFIEIRLGCLSHETENSQIHISICNKGPCVDLSSGKKIRNTYINPIKRRIRVNAQKEVRLPVGCECKVKRNKSFRCFN